MAAVPTNLKGEVVLEVGLLLALVPEALAPPRVLLAHLLVLEHETLGLHHVEEQLAHHVGSTGSGHLQTRPEPGDKKCNINYSYQFLSYFNRDFLAIMVFKVSKNLTQ